MTGHAHGAPPTTPERTKVSASRLIITLGGGGAVAGALIVIAYTLTLPPIEANRARRLNAAITEVLRHPARFDTLYLVGGALQRQPPAGTDPKTLEKVYLGHDKDGAATGYAVVAEAPGFADQIRVIFGYEAKTRSLLGMKVVENKETPGLGDRIEKDTNYVRQFAGVMSPIVGVKQGAGKGGKDEVVLITGATISSRTVVRIINDALGRLGPALEKGAPEGQ
jgi:electron transport complex protein RnfG